MRIEQFKYNIPVSLTVGINAALKFFIHGLENQLTKKEVHLLVKILL
jgi:hypothetical protein